MVTIRGSSIIIKTEKDAQDIQSKVAQIQMEYISFVVSTLTTAINQIIVDPIQDKMRKAGVSEKVIDRTYLDVQAVKEENSIVFSIKSDYVSDSGFDVAKMIENGRKAYFIKQKIKKMTWLKDGVRKWAKRYPEGIGVKIPEKTALHAIIDGITKGQPKVQKYLNDKTKVWVSETLKS